MISFSRKQPAEQARQHADWEEEAGPARHPVLAVERDAAARHDHMDMRMMGERRAPGTENRGDADAGAEMPGIGRQGPSLSFAAIKGLPSRRSVGHKSEFLSTGPEGQFEPTKIKGSDLYSARTYRSDCSFSPAAPATVNGFLFCRADRSHVTLLLSL